MIKTNSSQNILDFLICQSTNISGFVILFNSSIKNSSKNSWPLFQKPLQHLKGEFHLVLQSLIYLCFGSCKVNCFSWSTSVAMLLLWKKVSTDLTLARTLCSNGRDSALLEARAKHPNFYTPATSIATVILDALSLVYLLCPCLAYSLLIHVQNLYNTNCNEIYL